MPRSITFDNESHLDDVAVHRGRVGPNRWDLRPVYATVCALTLAGAVVFPSSGSVGPVSLLLLGVSVALVGMPHGAMDLAVSSAVGGPDRRRLTAAYVGAVPFAAALWILSPTVALAAFLGISAFHFGQSDLARHDDATVAAAAHRVTWGVFVLAMPIGLHAEAVVPILERLAVDGAMIDVLVRSGPSIAALSALAHALAISLLLTRPPAALEHRAVTPHVVGQRTRLVAGPLVLGVLFLRADPVTGFAIYFALWHSLPHLLDALAVARRAGVPVMTTLRDGFVGSGAVLVALAAVALVWSPGRTASGAIALLFVALSALTIPHLVIVDRMHGGGGRSSLTERVRARISPPCLPTQTPSSGSAGPKG